MLNFIENIKSRNELLFYVGLTYFAFALLFFLFTKISQTQVSGINAWYKPFKFALSIGIYIWTMAWYCYYLPSFNINLFNWVNIGLFGFEIVYIIIQAARGQESHFNLTSLVYRMLFLGMAVAATLITLYTAYIGVLFFQNDFPNLPSYYVWAIRLGVFIFVTFALEGFAMGARQTHSVGDAVATISLPLVKWNMTAGDLRVAHFIGMHSLQIIPLLSFYLLQNTKAVFIVSVIYLKLAILTLVQALQAKPFIKT